jgi:RNA polymerase sigma-70 factor (ECF subfamily)
MPETEHGNHHLNSRTNGQWLQELRAGGTTQEQAINELREILLRGSLYTFHRYAGEVNHLDQDQVLQWAEDCTQEALMAVLKHLADFRGESKFTTWAYKFSINTVLMAIRHERWKSVSLDELEPDRWNGSHPDGSMDQIAIRGEVGDILRAAIQEELSDKQRQVLKLIVFDEIPMDVVVERLGTNRNAVYQLLHDARLKLKQRLTESGFGIAEALELFSAR